jgi:YaiO family outer membrane protein
MILKKKLFFIFLFPALINSNALFAQEQLSSDQLFQKARSAAFDQKDYAFAIQLSKEALNISPDYVDIRIFLGRVYNWSDKIDSAIICFEKVLNESPENEDAVSAYVDLEYWNDNSLQALSICEKGLQFHPESKILLLKKAKCLSDLKRFKEANTVLSGLLKIDSKNSEARSLLEKIKDQSAQNRIGISYDFVKFDKQFDDPWHIVSVDYSRSTGIGSFTARMNYANRFKTNGVQIEADAYPRISKIFYAYLNAGISNERGVFPEFRTGFSLYANLPKSFEAEAGFRYLKFSDVTWIYTGSVGKYFKNYWFNIRTYIVPDSRAVSNSYTFTSRYYYKGTDYFGVALGSGISPDDVENNVQLTNLYKMKSYKVSADYKNTFHKMNSILLGFSFIQQEYQPKVTGHQYQASVGYQRRF